MKRIEIDSLAIEDNLIPNKGVKFIHIGKRVTLTAAE